MKTLLIYFSQTGNTYRIAKCICSGITDVTGQCDIVKLADVNKLLVGVYDLIGIGSPVFYYKEPFHVKDFIDSLPELAGQHWFIFCTHGSVIGNFFPSMKRKLNEKGATVIGYYDSYADIRVPYYPSPSFTTGHPDDYDFDRARDFGRAIVELSPRITNSHSDLIPIPHPVSSERWVREADIMTAEYLRHIMPKLNIDKDRCSQCHTCEKGCPVQGIDTGANPPRIQKPCIYCFHCVNICPSLAIRANWDKLVELPPHTMVDIEKNWTKPQAVVNFVG